LKKAIALLSACLLAASAFALDFNAGIGLNGGLESSTVKLSFLGGLATQTAQTHQLDFGAQAVAGFDYAQIGFGYLVKKDNGSTTTTTSSIPGATVSDPVVVNPTDANYSFISIEALGKYPVNVGGLKLIPMGGLEYDICVGAKGADGKAVDLSKVTDFSGKTVGASYFNTLSAKLGVGAEFAVGEKIVIRPQLLCSMGLYSAQNSDAKKTYESAGTELVTYSSSGFTFTAGVVVAYKL
jgi:hypothetical protein